MRAELPSIAYQGVSVGSNVPGHWPTAGLSIAYRLANFRIPRLGALLGASLLFYFF
ncbi:hypothetical protein O9Z70_07980 [Devosia sp. YIM 151766]|uniref:hypothetical protein n=1 Tax=Devosia sp. YIM 151766 TaxID=3017325 RepID=UPI00255CD768|nr:hypothetical protein [Devosia sp. YIM 151766]WIY54442.1 hypothetical protein O9Z70_07980 [Devosia sp. YIM 151766]